MIILIDRINAEAKKALKEAQDAISQVEDEDVNFHKLLDFGSQGVVLVQEFIEELQKQGQKGKKIGDFEHKDLPKFLKRIEEAKDNLEKSAIRYNKALANFLELADKWSKVVGSLEKCIDEIALDPDAATWSNAVKQAQKRIAELRLFDKFFASNEKGFAEPDALTRHLDIDKKTTLETLYSKVMMEHKNALTDWNKNSKLLSSQGKVFRKATMGDELAAVEKLAAESKKKK